MDFNDSIGSFVATDFNSEYNAASDIDPVSSSQKSGVTTSILSIIASTSVFTLQKFPARKPFKCFLQHSCRLVLQEIIIPAWPTHYFNAYNLFQ